jgi:ABC-2 type transport system ATP-binding protein
MSNNTPLSIENLNKSFGDHNVLNDVSFQVNKGEIFGLIGLNGAGKTTMIKIILGLLDGDSGEAKVFGQNSSIISTRKHLSFLPEKFQPSLLLKGREFLALTLSYYGKKYDHAEAERVATLLKLSPKVLNNRVSSYSKGMAQKLGLLSAFLVKAPFLMLDEPMSGLDPLARIQLKDALLDYVKDGNTIFFSSHILSDIDEICNTIAILHDSKIIYHGNPKEFKSQHNNDNLERAYLQAISNNQVASGEK